MMDGARRVRLPPSHEASADHHRCSDGGQGDHHWIRVATCDQIPPRQGRSVSIGDRELAIFNLGPSTELGAGVRFLAVDNQCPHKAGPLADGIVTGTSVVCPLHTWKINLADGCVERPQ